MNLLSNIKTKILEIADMDYTYPSTKKNVLEFINSQSWESPDTYSGTIDIIMPTFNRIRETKRIIRHLHNTTKIKFNLIIVDNNSNDGTKEYLKSLKESHNNIQLVLMDQNLGGAGSRNEGMKYITNEFVAFLDNDIYTMPNYFEQLLDTLVKNTNVSAVQSKVVMPNGLIQINRPEYILKDGWIIFLERDFEKAFDDSSTFTNDECNWLPSGATLWRASVLKDNKFDSSLGTYYEDNEFSFNLNKNGHIFMNNHKSICIHYSANFAPDKLQDSSYTKTRFNNDAIKIALKKFYKKHKLYLAYRDIEGHISHLGFSSKDEYKKFLVQE